MIDEEGTRERQEPRGPWTRRGERQTAAQPSLPFVYGSKGRAVLGRECCGRESIQEHSVLWRGVRACGAEGSGEGAKETGAAGREGAAGGTGWSGGRAGAGDWTERGEKGNGMEGEGVQLVGPPPAAPLCRCAGGLPSFTRNRSRAMVVSCWIRLLSLINSAIFLFYKQHTALIKISFFKERRCF